MDKKQKSKTSAAVQKKESETASQSVGVISNKVKRGTIHHKYREIEVVMTNGVVFKTFSTYKNNTLRLDIDVNTHPAWTRDSGYINATNSEVAKFQSKYNGFKFTSGK